MSASTFHHPEYLGNKATTFGAAGFFDDVALFDWGLSVDVARSKLISLPQLTQ